LLPPTDVRTVTLAMALVRGTQLFLVALMLCGTPAVAAAEAPTYQAVTLPGFPVTTEVLLGEHGPLAYRTRIGDGHWRLPTGDAVLLDEEWWTPLRPLVEVLSLAPSATTLDHIRERVAPASTRRLPDRLSALSFGDVTLDGEDDLVLSFRRPFKRNFINISRPRRAWADAHGLSAHVGLYRPDDFSEIWVAGTLVRPVTEVAACNGALAVAYGRLNRPGTVETGAWRWVVFGFLPTEPLPGGGTPTCVDIDRDGRTEPAIIGRSDP
jgi:hypothetical protein